MPHNDLISLEDASLNDCVGGFGSGSDFNIDEGGGGWYDGGGFDGGGFDGGGFDGGGFDGGGFDGGGFDGGGFDGGGFDGGGFDGGGGGSFTFDDGSTVGYDGTSTPAPEAPAHADPVDGLIDDMSPPSPEWDGAEPIDTTGVVPAEMSDAEKAALDRDLRENYRDGASPPEIYQGSGPGGADIGNCGIVSTLNGMAQTPEGQAHLAGMLSSNGDGSYTVHLVGPDGQPNDVTVWPGHDQSTYGDPNLSLIATGMAYANGMVPQPGDHSAATYEGVWPSDVMTQAGMVDVQHVQGPGATGDVRVVDTMVGPDVAHAYTDAGNGAYVNPYGFGHGVTDVRDSFAGNFPPSSGGGSDLP